MRKTLLKALLPVLTTLAVQQAAHATVVMVTVGPQSSTTFAPANATVNLGDTVRWVWASSGHNVVSTSVPAGATTFSTGPSTQSQGFTFDYKPAVVGTYNYVCTPHAPGMSGTLNVVQCAAPSAPTISPVPTTASSCAPSPVVLSVPNNSNYSYQWYKNGVSLGMTATTYTITLNNPGSNGSYTVMVTNNCGSATSAAVAVTVNPRPDSTWTSSSTNGFTYNFQATNTTPGTQYLWNFGGTNTATTANPSFTFTTNGPKTVSLKVTNPTTGCTGTLSKTITASGVGVATIAGNESFTVSPNPAGNELVVRTGNTEATISLLDYTGRLVSELTPASRTSNSLHFDVSAVPAGLYLLRIHTASGVATEKVQIIH